MFGLWGFISFYFGLVGLHSLQFGFVGLHFLLFWPFGPSFPFILAFSGSASGPPPQVAKNGPFAQRPYNGFISAVTGSILQFLALWAFISLHFGLVGLHFVAFWPCGPSFPCILALWAFISLHFGLVGRHFLAFWPCGPSFPFILAFSGSASGPPPHKLPKMARLPNVLTMDLSAPWPAPFCSFWPCGPSFPLFWPFGLSFPFIVAFWAFIPFIFAFWWLASGVPPTSFWGPTHKLPKLRGRRRHRCQRWWRRRRLIGSEWWLWPAARRLWCRCGGRWWCWGGGGGAIRCSRIAGTMKKTSDQKTL